MTTANLKDNVLGNESLKSQNNGNKLTNDAQMR